MTFLFHSASAIFQGDAPAGAEPAEETLGRTGAHIAGPIRQNNDRRSEATKGYEVKWSDKYQEPFYVYTDPITGAQREVWFENAATLKTKIHLVDKYKLSGVCIWRLGFEDPKFWDTLAKSWGKRK